MWITDRKWLHYAAPAGGPSLFKRLLAISFPAPASFRSAAERLIKTLLPLSQLDFPGKEVLKDRGVRFKRKEYLFPNRGKKP
jgi:hypothetical protein